MKWCCALLARSDPDRAGPRLHFKQMVDGQRSFLNQISALAAQSKEMTDRLEASCEFHEQVVELLEKSQFASMDKVTALEAQLERALKETADLRAHVRECLETAVPEAYLCPLRRTLLRNPAVAADGQTYEEEAIRDWIEENTVGGKCMSPVTHEPLPSLTIIPNMVFKTLITAHHSCMESLRSLEEAEIRTREQSPGKAPTGANSSVDSAQEADDSKASQAGPGQTHTERLQSTAKPQGSNGASPSNATPGPTPGHTPESSPRAPARWPTQQQSPSLGLASDPWLLLTNPVRRTSLATTTSSPEDTHPCLRVHGLCKYGDQCHYGPYPRQACLQYLKGKCEVPAGQCPNIHVEPKEGLRRPDVGAEGSAYKSRLCVHFAEGSCRHGPKCTYAHGEEEKAKYAALRRARIAAANPSYKTEICNFWKAGKCHHGDQCLYAHGEDDLVRVEPKGWHLVPPDLLL